MGDRHNKRRGANCVFGLSEVDAGCLFSVGLTKPRAWTLPYINISEKACLLAKEISLDHHAPLG